MGPVRSRARPPRRWPRSRASRPVIARTSPRGRALAAAATATTRTGRAPFAPTGTSRATRSGSGLGVGVGLVGARQRLVRVRARGRVRGRGRGRGRVSRLLVPRELHGAAGRRPTLPLPLPLILPLPLALTLTRRCRAPTSPAARAWSTLVAFSGGPGLDPNPKDERCPPTLTLAVARGLAPSVSQSVSQFTQPSTPSPQRYHHQVGGLLERARAVPHAGDIGEI